MRILLLEDDPRLGTLVKKGLQESAYAVDLFTDGESALIGAAVNAYDLFILDVGVPKKSGFEVAAELRRRQIRASILMLTARDTVPDRITGLDAGADDYLAKPFDFTELLARLRALLRRAPVVLPEEIQIEDLQIDTRAQCARRAGRTIELTAKEFAFLECLGRRANSIVTRRVISDHVWDQNHDPASNAIEVYINRLRHKIDLPGLTPLIHTRRGAGYFLGPARAIP
jgi:two-component system copper resistance phosphate regulon response regulator CusR